MDQLPIVSRDTKIQFFINLSNCFSLSILIITGLVLQFEYHMYHKPELHFVFGFNKFSWLLLHKISSIISLIGIIVHCIIHWKFISTITKKIFTKKQKSEFLISYSLFIIFIPTALTAISSWIFYKYSDNTRLLLMEIHDKIALVLIVLSLIHVILRFGRMVKIYQKLKLTN